MSTRSIAATIGSHAKGTVIGERVTVGHGATLFGTTLEDESLVGMGATLLENTKVWWLTRGIL